jgi:hypothetical protein
MSKIKACPNTFQANLRAVDEDKVKTDAELTGSSIDGIDEVIFTDEAKNRFVAYGPGLPKVAPGTPIQIDCVSGRVDMVVKDPTEMKREDQGLLVAGLGIAGFVALTPIGATLSRAEQRFFRTPGFFGKAVAAAGIGVGVAGIAAGAYTVWAKDDAEKVLSTHSKPVSPELRLSNGLVEQAMDNEFDGAFMSGEQLEKQKTLSKMNEMELRAYLASAIALGKNDKEQEVRAALEAKK